MKKLINQVVGEVMKEILLALDIGNVCVRINHANFASALGIEKVPEELLLLARDYEWGIIRDEKTFIRRGCQLLEERFSESELLEAFESILIDPVPGMVELSADFQKMGVKAVFFSDISPIHLKRTEKLVPELCARCAGGVFSFDAGAWKPSAAMFERFEKLYGVPDIYTDDRLELIEGAKSRPWNAYQFAGAEDLREKLLSLS